MSDIFQFNGAEGSGWSQPEPMIDGATDTLSLIHI